MWFFKTVLGAIVGAFVGAILGVLAAFCLGVFSAWVNPEDPSAGSMAIMVIATGPLGFCIGIPVGAAVALYRTPKPNNPGIRPDLTAHSILHPDRDPP